MPTEWWRQEIQPAPEGFLRYVVLVCPECSRALVSFGSFSESRVRFNTALRYPCCDAEPKVVVEDMGPDGRKKVYHVECAS